MQQEIYRALEQEKGLVGLAEIGKVASKIPSVSIRLARARKNHFPEEYKDWTKPKKTMPISFAALERYSPCTVESVTELGLALPGAIAVNALAVEWDDWVDGSQEKGIVFDCQSEKMWAVAMKMLETNENIPLLKRGPLIKDLEVAKAGYMAAEMQLKALEPDSLSPQELLVRTVDLRTTSFGTIAHTMTRIFTGGVVDTQLERRMRNITLGLGVFDGMVDLKEDRRDHTMTEARASLRVDRELGLVSGTTAVRLINFYMNENVN